MSRLLTVSGLTKRYKEHVAVNDISFNIEEGRCVTLLGPNGAGKTTTLKMLAGLLKASAGSIAFQGANEGEDRRRLIGYLPQYPAYYNWMTGREFLLYVGQLSHMSIQEARKRADELLHMVGIEEAKNRRIGSYSGGMRQRLGLAQAMMHEPKLLILDEPVSALDPVGRRDVLQMMGEIKKQTTVLFSTHVLHDAEMVSDDVIIIHNGKIVIEGELAAVREQHQQPIITIELDREAERHAFINRWQDDALVSELTVDHHTVKLIVQDVGAAQNALLKHIVEQQFAMRKFEVGQTTLEDLFMKAVSV